MEAIDKAVGVLNDLIEVNNDRVAEFAKAVKDLKFEDNDLKILIEILRDDSKFYVHELGREVYNNGGEPEIQTAQARTMHGIWHNIKSTFVSADRKTVLRGWKRGEEEIKTAYENVLALEDELSSDIMEMVYRQKEEIDQAYHQLKLYIDQKAA